LAAAIALAGKRRAPIIVAKFDRFSRDVHYIVVVRSRSLIVLALDVMSRARLRELVVLFAICSALTLAVFFLALWLLPFETFTPFPFPRFPGFF
jgi:hypothetical protein